MNFSIYVHIPYCRVKCPYCDFNVSAAKRRPENEYTRALGAELEAYAQLEPWRGGAVQTIYFGGGTPSLFGADSIGRVIEAVRTCWPDDSRPDSARESDSRRVETTLEANPGTLEPAGLRALRAAGVNRLSLGVQSFDPHHLARLGRDHTCEEAVESIDLARQAGFDSVSLDLMFAIPGQTLSDCEADLRTAIRLGPDHISAYNLTYEPKTRFFAMRARGELTAVDDDVEAAMFSRTRELLGAAGYRAYEISNFARPGHESRHNLNYWEGGEYLGVGCGAHSFARAPRPARRWSNERHPRAYMRRVAEHSHARSFEEVLTERQSRGEFVFLGLRRLEGFGEGEFTARFGVEFDEAFPQAERLEREGLLVHDASRWRLTERGLLFADGVFAEFL